MSGKKTRVWPKKLHFVKIAGSENIAKLVIDNAVWEKIWFKLTYVKFLQKVLNATLDFFL